MSEHEAFTCQSALFISQLLEEIKEKIILPSLGSGRNQNS